MCSDLSQNFNLNQSIEENISPNYDINKYKWQLFNGGHLPNDQAGMTPGNHIMDEKEMQPEVPKLNEKIERFTPPIYVEANENFDDIRQALSVPLPVLTQVSVPSTIPAPMSVPISTQITVPVTAPILAQIPVQIPAQIPVSVSAQIPARIQIPISAPVPAPLQTQIPVPNQIENMPDNDFCQDQEK